LHEGRGYIPVLYEQQWECFLPGGSKSASRTAYINASMSKLPEVTYLPNISREDPVVDERGCVCYFNSKLGELCPFLLNCEAWSSDQELRASWAGRGITENIKLQDAGRMAGGNLGKPYQVILKGL
jgi:hypothetical protein